MAAQAEECAANLPGIVVQLIAAALAVEVVGVEAVALELDVVHVLDECAALVTHVLARPRRLLDLVAFPAQGSGKFLN